MTHLLVLLAAALFIVGPEGLPAAAGAVGKAIRQMREYASGAREQLKGEFGAEFDELRGPLAELQQLRGLTPHSVIARQLFGGDPNPVSPGAGADGSAPPPVVTMTTSKAADPLTVQRPLTSGERPPFDVDAT